MTNRIQEMQPHWEGKVLKYTVQITQKDIWKKENEGS